MSLYLLPNECNRGYPDESIVDKSIIESGFTLDNQIKIGMYSGKCMEWDFSKSFYEHAGVDYDIRFNYEYSSRILNASKSIEQTSWVSTIRRCLIHDDRNRGYKIRDEYLNGHGVYDNGESILRYVNMITTARYIDVIDSSVYWLVELLGPLLDPECELRLHRYAKGGPKDKWWCTKLNWKYID
jgi:hypothetical protein